MVGIVVGIIQIDRYTGTVRVSRRGRVTIGDTLTASLRSGKIKMEQIDCSIFILVRYGRTKYAVRYGLHPCEILCKA